MVKKLSQTERLLKIVHELRTLCPWDRKQTHHSLVPYFIEETFEAVSAIESRNRADLMEELGDVLLQVVLHAELANESGHFNFEDVARTVSDKMVRRHPHIYGNKKYKDYKSHLKNWTESKKKEKPHAGRLDGLPSAMPALMLSKRYGEVASTIGFDWPNLEGVLKKVQEEWLELNVELKKRSKNTKRVTEELGDLLFTISQLGRHLGIDGEQALRVANQKFRKRFQLMEQKLAKANLKGKEKPNLKHLEAMWNQVKRS